MTKNNERQANKATKYKEKMKMERAYKRVGKDVKEEDA